MLPISVRPATSLCWCNIDAVAVVNDGTAADISVAVVFNVVANNVAVAIISLVALVIDSALEVVNVCCI